MTKNYTIHDKSVYKYFSTIPYIIYELGLCSVDLSIYSAIKRSAGDGGYCTRSKENLAKHAGVSERTLHRHLPNLTKVFEKLKKPLITISKRKTEHGDDDTDLITIVDIWEENFIFNEGGGANVTPPPANLTPPDVNLTPGVVSDWHQGGVSVTPKVNTFKKNNIKKTTTPTPSKGKVVAVVDEKFSNEEKKAAQSLKTWVDNESMKDRELYIDKYSKETVQWGKSWIIPIETYCFLIRKYGMSYFNDQLQGMYWQQMENDKIKNVKKREEIRIKFPERFLKKSCKENFATSIQRK